MGRNGRGDHGRALDTIVNNASDFGIPDFKGYAREVQLFKDNGKKSNLTDIDILFFLTDGSVLLVEYKSNGNGSSTSHDKASDQIAKAAAWVAKYTPYNPDQIGTRIISGDDPNYKRLLKK